MASERRNISQPEEWWAAFEQQAKRDGADSLSKWIGEVCISNLEDDLWETCYERPPAHRPKKEEETES